MAYLLSKLDSLSSELPQPDPDAFATAGSFAKATSAVEAEVEAAAAASLSSNSPAISSASYVRTINRNSMGLRGECGRVGVTLSAFQRDFMLLWILDISYHVNSNQGSAKSQFFEEKKT